MRRFLAVLCLVLMLCGCGAEIPEITVPGTTVPETTIPETTVPETMVMPTTEPADPAHLLLEGMTLRQKVGQLFLVRPESITGGEPEKTWVTEAMTSALAQYPVGGFILFAENITDRAHLAVFNASLRETCAVVPFLAVDEEGGRVARLANHAAFSLPRYDSAASVGSSGDPGTPCGWVIPSAAIFGNTASTWTLLLWRM